MTTTRQALLDLAGWCKLYEVDDGLYMCTTHRDAKGYYNMWTKDRGTPCSGALRDYEPLRALAGQSEGRER
jgi:hypothetical protein